MEDSQKQELYASILEKYGTDEIEKAKRQSRQKSKVANWGEIAEGFVRSGGMAVGGQGVDKDFYQDMRDSGRAEVKDATSDRKQAITDYLTQKNLDRQATQDEFQLAKHEDTKAQNAANELWRQKQSEENQRRNERDYKQRERQIDASLKRQEAAVVKADAKEVRELENLKKGKSLTAQATTDVGELDSADKLIDDLFSDYKKNASDYGAGITSALPWSTDAGNFDQTRRQKAQVIGGILEGGKLTDPDFERYYDMMPSPWDTDAQAENKINELKETLKIKRQTLVKTLDNAGFAADGLKTEDSPNTQVPSSKKPGWAK